MLTAKVLNSDATINSFNDIGSLQFIPGEQIRVVLRLDQPQRADRLRFIIENPAAIVTAKFPKSDLTYLSKTMTAFANDRSIWYVDLSETETADLLGGAIEIDIDEDGTGTKITKALAPTGLSRIITGC